MQSKINITNTHAIKIDFYNLNVDSDCNLQSVIDELDNHPELEYTITLRYLGRDDATVAGLLKDIFQHKNVHTINFELSTFPYLTLFDTPHIQEINIFDSTDNCLFQDLAQIIEDNTTIKKLTIHNKETLNHPRNTSFGFLIKTIAEHRSIESIDLTGFQLSLAQLNYLLEGIKSNKIIKTINLSQINAINDQFIKKMADIIFANGLPNIEWVGFSNNGFLLSSQKQLRHALKYAEQKRQGMDCDISQFFASRYSPVNFLLPKFDKCFDDQFIEATKKVVAENRKNKETFSLPEGFYNKFDSYLAYDVLTKIKKIETQLNLQGYTYQDVEHMVHYLDWQSTEDDMDVGQLPPSIGPFDKWEAYLFLNEVNKILQFDGIFHDQDANSFLIQCKNHLFIFHYGEETGLFEIPSAEFDFNPEEGFTKEKEISAKYLDGKILQKMQQLFLESKKDEGKIIERTKKPEEATDQNGMKLKFENNAVLFSPKHDKKVKTQNEVIAVESLNYKNK